MRSIHTFFVRPCETKHQLIILIAAFAMVQYSVPIAPTEHTAAPGGEGHTNTSGVATEDVFLAPTCSPLCDPAVNTAAIPDVDIKPEPELAVQSRPQDDAVPQDDEPSLFPSALQLLVCSLATCLYHCVQLRSELARRPERDTGAAAETKAVDGEHPAAEIDVELARCRAQLMALATSRLDDVVAQEGRARHSTTEHCNDEWAAIAHQFTVGMQLLAALASQRTAHEEEMRTVREACRAITNTKKETIRRLAADADRHEAEKEAMAQENVQLKGQLEQLQRQSAQHDAAAHAVATQQQTEAHERAVRDLEAAHAQALQELSDKVDKKDRLLGAQAAIIRQLSADVEDAKRKHIVGCAHQLPQN